MCGAACTVPIHAQAYGLWVWVDEQGRKTYSNQHPPQHIATDHIIQQPQSPAQSLGLGNDVPLLSGQGGAHTTLSPRETVRRDNCLAAQASLDRLRSRKNWLVEDENGSRQAMDDGMRRAEAARLRQIMRDNCTYAR